MSGAVLLDEHGVAERIGLGGCTPLEQKRRVRKLIRLAGIEPKKFGRTWMIPESLLEKLTDCPSQVRASPIVAPGEISAASKAFRLRRAAKKLRDG